MKENKLDSLCFPTDIEKPVFPMQLDINESIYKYKLFVGEDIYAELSFEITKFANDNECLFELISFEYQVSIPLDILFKFIDKVLLKINKINITYKFDMCCRYDDKIEDSALYHYFRIPIENTPDVFRL